MRVYVSGPMSGLPNFNYPAFHAAAKLLRDRGHDVVNPAELNSTTDAYAVCIMRDIEELLTCEAIVRLPGWKRSRGALLENKIAMALRMEIVELETVKE